MSPKTKICPGCNDPFEARPNAKVCSSRCRKRLHRAKQLVQREVQKLAELRQVAIADIQNSLMPPQLATVSAINSDQPYALDEAESEDYPEITHGPLAINALASVMTPTHPAGNVTAFGSRPQFLSPPKPWTPPTITPQATSPSTGVPTLAQPQTTVAQGSPPLNPANQPTYNWPEIESLSSPQSQILEPSTSGLTPDYTPQVVNPASISAGQSSQTLGLDASQTSSPLFANDDTPQVTAPAATSLSFPASADSPTVKTPWTALFSRRPYAIALSFATVIIISTGALNLTKALFFTSSSSSSGQLASQKDQAQGSSDLASSTLTLNLDTTLTTGKKLTLSQLVADPSTGSLQLTGDFNASGILGADSGSSSLSGSNLVIDNVVVCNSSGCLPNSNVTTGGNATPGLTALPVTTTLQGNSFNGSSQLVQLTEGGLLPVLSGANLTTVDAISLQGNNASFYTNATNLSSGTLTDTRLSTNVALLGASGPQTFSGNNKFTGSFLVQSSTNSTTAFSIQNAAGTSNLLVADTTNSRIGIGTATPAYTLDVNGDINSTTGVRVNGALLCNAGGCTASSGSASYIQNDIVLQSANFNLRSATTTSVTAAIRALATQTADLLQLKDSAGVNVLTIGPTGNTLIQPSTNSINAFSVQNALGTSLLISGDTLNARVAIATTLPPNYTLDVGGDINSTTGLRVAGNLVCSLTCTPGGGSGNYIQNESTIVQTANFAIQSDLNSHIVAYIRGASGQAADLLDVVGKGVGDVNLPIATFGASGAVLFQNAIDSTAAFRLQNLAGNNYLLLNTSGASMSLGDTGIASTVQIGNTTGAVAQTINIGNNATAASATTLVLGSTIGTSATTIQGGSGDILLSATNTAIGTSSVAANGVLTIGTDTQVATGGIYFGTDTALYRSGTGALTIQGTGNSTLKATNATGSDTAGSSLMVAGGQGTGTGNGGNIGFQIAQPAAVTTNLSFVASVTNPYGMTIDSTYIYWVNNGGANDNKIGRSLLDGTSVNQAFIAGTSPYYVTVDSTHVFWTNISNTSIGRANIDGTSINNSFITGTGTSPAGIAVDGTYIYWSNYAANTIGRANLDGTSKNNNFITGTSNVESIAVNASYIYWTNYGTNTIGRANLDGTIVNQSFITSANTPLGVAVDTTYIYWTNYTLGVSTVGRANLDGTSPNQNFITGVSVARAIAVNSTYIYWSHESTNTIARQNIINPTAVNSLATVASISGVSGNTLFQNSTDSTTAFRIQNLAGNNLVLVDTTTAAPIVSLGVTGSTALASTVNIATTTGNSTQTINIGATNSANNAVLIQGGTGASAISLQAGTSGTISLGTTNVNTVTIGSTANTGILTFGRSTAGETINIGNGNVASGNTNTVNIGATATSTGKNLITIGSLVAASTLTLQGGNTSSAVSIQSAASGTISLGTSGVANTIQMGNTTGAVAQTINIGNNSTVASTNNINIGSSIAGTMAITGPTTIAGRSSGSETGLAITNSTTTQVGLSIQAAASQTGNLFTATGPTIAGYFGSVAINGYGAVKVSYSNSAISGSLAGSWNTTNLFENLYACNCSGSGIYYSATGPASAVSLDNSGNIYLNVAASGSAGAAATLSAAQTVSNIGAVTFKNRTNSTTALQVQNLAGNNLVLVDTTTAAPIVSLGVTGSTALASTVNIATTTGNSTQTINIGATNSANNAVLIQGGTGASAISLQAGTSGTISLGTTNVNTVTVGSISSTAVLTLGQSTDTNEIDIGNANTADTKTQTIKIGAGTGVTTGKSVLTIGSTANASATTIQGGTGNINLLSTGNIVIGTSDTTGTLLVLDTKTSAGDPTCTNGGVYYNSSTNLLRACANSVWSTFGPFAPGYEYDYSQFTSDASITATTEATANTVVSNIAVTFDGSTTIMLNAYVPEMSRGTTWVKFAFYDGSTSLGIINPSGYNTSGSPGSFALRITPSAASHTYSLRAWVDAGTATLPAGSGGAGSNTPGYIRITKAN